MGTQVHRLFFALLPDAALSVEIERTVAAIKAGGLVRGHWVNASKLHLTLQFLGDFFDADDAIARSRRAGANVRRAPFEFTLDRAATFPRRFNPPCVLRCAAESESDLRSFHAELGMALRVAGLREHLDRQPYLPHLTIAYAKSALPADIAIEPIIWKADGFALMDSHVGRSTHEQIERWPLRA